MVSISVSLSSLLLDMKETFGWLKSANLPGATEGLVAAAQDQALRTLYYSTTSYRDVSPTCPCAPGDSRPHCDRL